MKALIRKAKNQPRTYCRGHQACLNVEVREVRGNQGSQNTRETPHGFFQAHSTEPTLKRQRSESVKRQQSVSVEIGFKKPYILVKRFDTQQMPSTSIPSQQECWVITWSIMGCHFYQTKHKMRLALFCFLGRKGEGEHVAPQGNWRWRKTMTSKSFISTLLSETVENKPQHNTGDHV